MTQQPLIVFFSSATENTLRFVHKLGFPNIRIPIFSKDSIEVNEDFILITPTYGGGASMDGRESNPVPKQVEKFLSNPTHAKHMKGVIAGGNINFGEDYCKAGVVISRQYNVPYLWRFELLGTPHDVETVQKGITEMFSKE
mgnify:CR=1 FL=1